MVSVFVKDDKTTYFVKPGTAFIDTNIPIPYGCQQGCCGSCLIRIVDGNVPGQQEAFLKEVNADPDMRLACQCIIESDIEIEISP